MSSQLPGGAATGFVNTFLKVPQATGLDCSCHAAQASNGNFHRNLLQNLRNKWPPNPVDDIRCIKDKRNFWRQIWNPQLNRRGLTIWEQFYYIPMSMPHPVGSVRGKMMRRLQRMKNRQAFDATTEQIGYSTTVTFPIIAFSGNIASKSPLAERVILQGPSALPVEGKTTINNGWGGHLCWRFCYMFSKSSPCLLGQHGSCSTDQQPGELS